jgi:hypothetical protein
MAELRTRSSERLTPSWVSMSRKQRPDWSEKAWQ